MLYQFYFIYLKIHPYIIHFATINMENPHDERIKPSCSKIDSAIWVWDSGMELKRKKKAKENFDCTIIYRGEIRERRWTEQTVYQLWPSTCWDQKQPWLVGLRLQQSLRLKCSKNSTRPANITLWVHSRPPTWHNFISNK